MARFARLPIKNNLQKECCTTRRVIEAHKFPNEIARELMRFAATTLSRPQRSVRNKKQISQKTIEARLYGVCSAIDTLIDLK